MLWGLNLIGVATVLLLFIDSPKTANVAGYVLVCTAQFVCMYSIFTFYTEPFEMPWYFLLLPNFAFSRLYYFLSKRCVEAACYQRIGDLQGEAFRALIVFSVTAFVYPIIGITLNHIKLFGFPRCSKSVKNTNDSLESSVVYGEKLNAERETFDATGIKTESKLVQGLKDTTGFPLVVCGLTKSYERDGEPMKVLDNVSFRIAKGEVLGLLGPNGAGKTTLISILTGQVQPDSGEAWVGGHHIGQELSSVYKHIGVCPQFDLFWEDLTVVEHLLFYLRLKGCESSDELASVDKVCSQVELLEHKDKLAKELSGGMKRRLSLAISLIGDPLVVFLDEPTTGLDPLNREIFWKILEKVKANKSIVLTTHLMQEADHLSDRIAIIHQGSLRCIGTPTELKRNLGAGLILQVIFERCQIVRNKHSYRSIDELLKYCQEQNIIQGYKPLDESQKLQTCKYLVISTNEDQNK